MFGRSRTFGLATAVVSGLLGTYACAPRVPDAVLRAALDSAIQAQAGTLDDDVAKAVKRWYDAHDHQFTWRDGDQVEIARAVIRSSATHGLNPEWYGSSRIDALRTTRRQPKASDAERSAQLAMFDVLVTSGLMHAGRDVSIGHTKPTSLDRSWKMARTPPDLVATLSTAYDDGTLSDWFDTIAPRHPEYAQLRGWLAGFGHVDRATPLDPRVGQIIANLDRVRWLPDDLGERHLIVNIPEFMLRVREGRRTVLEMRVVVGKPHGHETPVLSGALEAVVFNPYWNLPDSIVLAETLPAIERDPEYLERHDMEVLRVSANGTAPIAADDVDWGDPAALKQVRIRQRPGDDNALGKYKFPFRNAHAIYLHDTPSQALFARESRAFSHGCVRVAEPDVLARYVLSGDPDWTPARIDEAVGKAEELQVHVNAELPVHLVYITVVAGPDGQPRYLSDVYGFDRKQLDLR